MIISTLLIAQAQTIALDTTLIRQFKDDAQYDYNRELMVTDSGIIDRIREWLMRFIEHVFDVPVGYIDNWVVWLIMSLILIGLLFTFTYFRFPEWFHHARDNQNMAYVVSEDTIYGVDFDAEIAKAQQAHQYAEVVRLVYLQTLKWLDDRNRIQWADYKTPTQYTYEEKTVDFKQFTHIFLKVRFGRFEADEALVEETLKLQQLIKKGGEA